MGTGIFQNKKKYNNFDGLRDHRLGTQKQPAELRVKTEEKRTELEATCKENKWHCSITVDPEQDEDLSQLEELQNVPKTVVNEVKAGRNDPCPCGSGSKYKKCCGKPKH